MGTLIFGRRGACARIRLPGAPSGLPAPAIVAVEPRITGRPLRLRSTSQPTAARAALRQDHAGVRVAPRGDSALPGVVALVRDTSTLTVNCPVRVDRTPAPRRSAV
jgi:hypothetical protein